MRIMAVAMSAVLALSACKTVVTTTTEIRPSRYAGVEFTRQVSRDAIMNYAERAMREENVRVQKIDEAAATVTGGPVKFAAAADEPSMEATITISTETRHNETRIRVFASSLLEEDQIGGKDARLALLVQRVSERIDSLIGH